MESYNIIINRRKYPGQVDIIPPELPKTYRPSNFYMLSGSNSCNTCFFKQNNICSYWNAEIRENYICDIWRDPNSSEPLPEDPPCHLELSVPVMLTQDFDDIGIYTPWDGLAYQRDVINNFVYTGMGNSITVYNSSNVEFKKFLSLAPYTIDWGDGGTTTLTSTQLSTTHVYATPSSGYTVSMQQINPWGTTYIKKRIPIPYTMMPSIPNPFGSFAISPPNIGEPIGCEYITEDYIFQGDSDPDVWNFFSSNYVAIPFAVTGQSYTSHMNVLLQYGSGYPAVGVQVYVGMSGTGIINTMTPAYTSYTINDISYTDWSAGTTTYRAMSKGINPDNVDHYCCDDPEECVCNTQYPTLDCWMVSMGMSCMTIDDYLQGGGPPCIGLTTQECLDSCPTCGPPPGWAHISPITGLYEGSSDQGIYCSEQECLQANGLKIMSPLVGSSMKMAAPERLFECGGNICTELMESAWVDPNTGANNYPQMLLQPNMFDNLSDCNSHCGGCVSMSAMSITITNVQTCSLVTVTNPDNTTYTTYDCDGVVEINGLDSGQSSQYEITCVTTGEMKLVTPVNGMFGSVEFDNLCPTNYSNINGQPFGLYIFTILDDKGCIVQETVLVDSGN
jgi:hypothetical protein